VEEKLEIANFVHELIVTEKDSVVANSEKLIDTLRCVLEETDIRIGELKKDAYEFKRAVVVGSVNPRTGKITAEKVIRYMEDKLKQMEGIIGKLRLKNANMKAQMQSMQLQLTKKEEAGDVLHYIDFHQLQIENSQILGKVDESNKEMLHLKISGGKTTAALNEMKSNLSTYVKDSVWLQQELGSKYVLFEKMKKAVTTLRLADYGCPNRPYFHIVDTRRRVARNRGYYEQVGTYDPMPNDRNEKLVALNMDRIKYWLSQGCSTSRPVTKLLGLAGIFPIDERTLNKADLNRQKLVKSEKSAEDEVAQ